MATSDLTKNYGNPKENCFLGYHPEPYETPLPKLKTIIAGSRIIRDYRLVVDAIKDSKYKIIEVVSGNAIGVDRLGERWAYENSVPVKLFLADWKQYGKRAGYIRNEQMAAYADALIAVWDGKSSGTKHMIDIAQQYRLKVFTSIV